MPRPRKDAPPVDAAAQVEQRRAVNTARQARHRARQATRLARYEAALARVRTAATLDQARETAREALADAPPP